MESGTFSKIFGPVTVPNTATTIYNNTSYLLYDIIKNIHVVNTRASPVTCSLWLSAGDGLSTAGTEIFTTTLPAKGIIDWKGRLKVTLNDFVVGLASASSSLVIRADGEKFTQKSNPISDATKLLMHMDGTNGSTTFTDVIGHTMTANTGAPTISTGASQFGGASGLFAAADHIQTVASDLAFGTGDFTIEFFINYTLQGGRVFDSVVGVNYWFIENNFGSGHLQIDYQDYAGNIIIGAANYNDGLWHHVAVVRKVNTITLYIDGTSQGTASTFANYVAAGYGFSLGGGFVGNLDEIRVLNGIAVYTANFTPPTAPFAL